MATTLIENIVSIPNAANRVLQTTPVSTTTSETFTFQLNNSKDDFYIIIDSIDANPIQYTLTFQKGISPAAMAIEPFTFTDGAINFFPMESGFIEGKNAEVNFTITAVSGTLATSGLKLALVKKRFVTNN